MNFEGNTIEYKQEWVEDIIPELVSFLNSHGGTLFIGINDTGEVIGVSDPDILLTKVTNKIRDCISPSASMLIYSEITKDSNSDKYYITCQVSKGTCPPYYVTQRGTLKGVYIRSGSSKKEASQLEIKTLIASTDPFRFENQLSREQDLTFNEAKFQFSRRNIEFGSVQMKNLGITSEGLYTNLGLWISDQCPYILKAASFEGTDVQNFQHRAEMQGSLLRQYQDTMQFVSIHNPVNSYINPKTWIRQDTFKFPDYSVREAILNALVHRDYTLDHPTQLKVFSDRIEIVSFGSLLPELSISELGMGISACRNPKLANLFYRLGLIEAYGTGIQRIQQEYQRFSRKPEIYSNPGTFRIVLPSSEAYEKTAYFSQPTD